MAGRDQALGSKLGPRLAQLMAQATIATKQGLADTEHRLRVNSTRTIVDWAGVEFSQIMGPLLDPVLRQNVMPPNVQKVLENITSGRNQWQAFAGVAFGLSGAPGMMGTIMNNFLAPYAYAAVYADPHLIPDIGTLATINAHNAMTGEILVKSARELGYSEQWFQALTLAAQSVPDITTLIELLRGSISEARARQVADLNGISHDDLGVIVDNTGEPPAVEELLGLWRRGAIGEAELERGIRQSRVRNEWIPAVKQLGIIPPSPADALDAYLKGQIGEGTAKQRFEQAGGDPTWFQTAYDAAGEAPSPVEAGEMANRGLIPWTGTGPGVVSFEQAFLEGPWRNKWLKPFRAVVEYLPPPRTVTALLNEGAITVAEAQDLLQKTGLTPELAKAYTLESSHTKTRKQRDLTVSQIETLYRDQAIDQATATAMLVSLGYDDTEAAFIVTTVDFQRISTALSQAVGAVHTAYTNHRIDRATASGQLDGLQVPAGQRDQLLTVWANERATRVRVLTEAQVHAAFKKGILDQDGAMTRLVQMGYSDQDAAILLQL